MKFRHWLVYLLILSLALLTACSDDDNNNDDQLHVSDIESIQAYTDQTFYGEGLVSVDITYKAGVHVSEVTADTYILEDRGVESPDFHTLAIDDVVVNGQVVTLFVNTGTGATDENALIYRGDNATGSRLKVTPSVYIADNWYRSVDGNIHYGDEDSDDYVANTAGVGYYTRESLELKLHHSGEPEESAASLANEYGRYNKTGLWKETIAANFNSNGFISFEDAEIYIPSTAATSLDGDADPYVRGWVYVPESYDGSVSVPLIITIAGNGTSFWILPDGTNNFGTGAKFDASGIRWMDSGAIVLNIHDRSIVGGGGDDYDFVVDDVNTIKYFLENYNVDQSQIVLSGNSRSTAACDQIIRALAGLTYSANQDGPNPTAPDRSLPEGEYNFTIGTFVCNNGALLRNFPGFWDDYETSLPVLANTGLRFWATDGEQDMHNNIAIFKELVSVYSNAGYSDEWIEENLRLSGYPSELFSYWGVSDHNVTRVLYHYFYDTIYYGPDLQVVDGEVVYNSQVQPGETYQLLYRGNPPSDPEYEYLVYPESTKEWVLNP